MQHLVSWCRHLWVQKEAATTSQTTLTWQLPSLESLVWVWQHIKTLSEEEDQESQVSQWSSGAYLRSCCGHCSMWIKKPCIVQPVWTEERFLLKVQPPPPFLLYQSWAKCQSQARRREALSGWQSLTVEEKNGSGVSNWTAQGLSVRNLAGPFTALTMICCVVWGSLSV